MRCFPEMMTRRCQAIDPGHLVLTELDVGVARRSFFALSAEFGDNHQRILVALNWGDVAARLAIRRDHVGIDFGTDWVVEVDDASAIFQPQHVPMGALIVGDEGLASMCIQANNFDDPRLTFPAFQVGEAAGRADYIFTRWKIFIGAGPERRNVVDINAVARQ